MDLHIDVHMSQVFIIALITNCGGILISFVAVVSVVKNSATDSSIRCIVLSFSVANVMGTVLSSYYTFVLVNTNAKESTLMTISELLSVTHLILLMLAEHVVVTSATLKRRASDFVGLLITAWMMSITVGMTNVVSHEQVHIFFALLFLFVLTLLTLGYRSLQRKHGTIKKIQSNYQRAFLRVVEDRRVARGHRLKRLCLWKLKYHAFILFSYNACSLPWILVELCEGFGIIKHRVEINCVSLIVYSFNFYVPSAICIYLGYVQWVAERRRGDEEIQYVERRSRYRDLYYVF